MCNVSILATYRVSPLAWGCPLGCSMDWGSVLCPSLEHVSLCLHIPSSVTCILPGLHKQTFLSLKCIRHKIFFCLFERPFETQKNGVFLFEISFFRFRDIDIFLVCKLDQ